MFILNKLFCYFDIWFLILLGEYNVIYIVVFFQEGFKFIKIRYGYLVQYVRVNYSKVILDQLDCRQLEYGFSGYRYFGQFNRKVIRGLFNFQKSLGL